MVCYSSRAVIHISYSYITELFLCLFLITFCCSPSVLVQETCRFHWSLESKDYRHVDIIKCPLYHHVTRTGAALRLIFLSCQRYVERKLLETRHSFVFCLFVKYLFKMCQPLVQSKCSNTLV